MKRNEALAWSALAVVSAAVWAIWLKPDDRPPPAHAPASAALAPMPRETAAAPQETVSPRPVSGPQQPSALPTPASSTAAGLPACLPFEEWRVWYRDWILGLPGNRRQALQNWMQERGLQLPDPDGRPQTAHAYAVYDSAALRVMAGQGDVVAKKFLAQRVMSEALQRGGVRAEWEKQINQRLQEREQLLMDVAAAGDIAAVFELRAMQREIAGRQSKEGSEALRKRVLSRAQAFARFAEWRGGFRDTAPLSQSEAALVEAHSVEEEFQQLKADLQQRRAQQGLPAFDNSVSDDYQIWRKQWRRATQQDCVKQKADATADRTPLRGGVDAPASQPAPPLKNSEPAPVYVSPSASPRERNRPRNEPRRDEL